MRNQRFTETYEQYKNLIMKIVFDRSGDSHLAEDICQQVFVSFYQRMDDINENFCKAWLMLAARNAVIDYQRKKRFRKESVLSEVGESVAIASEYTAEQIVERMAASQLTFRILADLKVTNKSWYQVVEAICILEMTHEEAANHLRLEPQVIRSKLYRARKYIRNKYTEAYTEP